MRLRVLLFLLCGTLSAVAAPKTVRLLTVGNSFADNALEFLPKLADAAGHELIVGRANLGGCTLERHWRHVAAHEADSSNKEGSPYRGGKYSLADMLGKNEWDYVTIQQVSYKSHDPATYQPYADKQQRFIAKRAPQARILAHQIWAYRVDDPRFVPENKGKEPHTQQEMYEQVRKAYHALARRLDIGIIPSGDAMYLADTDAIWGFRPDLEFDFASSQEPELPRQRHSLHRGWYWRKGKDGRHALKIDGHHASQAGEYLLGCVWFEIFFGESVVENAFVPRGIDKEYARFLRETAHAAVKALAEERSDRAK